MAASGNPTSSGFVGADGRPGASLFDSPAVLSALVAFGFATFLWQQGPSLEQLLRLALPDNDDAMRLLSVRDLIAGQGWFDTTQHRYLPPAGASMHWSRFLDAPLALLIVALTPLLGRGLAEVVVVAAWPPCLLVVALGLAGTAAYRLFGIRAAAFAVFAGTQSALALLFVPGRIDHHNVQAILMLGAALALARPEGWRPAAVAGGLAALSLAVGLESLPFVAAAGLAVGARWIVMGPAAARSFLGFAGALALAAPVLFGSQTDPTAWFAPECDALSPPWILLVSGSGVVAAALANLRLESISARLMAGGALGAGLLAILALAYPHCLGGPYADLPPLVRAGWLAEVGEAMPLWRAVPAIPYASIPAFGPLLAAAILATIGALRLGPDDPRRMLAFHAVFLWTGVLVSLAQVRGHYIGSAFIPLVAGWAFDRALDRLRTPGSLARGAAMLLPCLLLLGRVWSFGVFVADIAVTASAGRTAARASDEGFLSCTDRAALAPLDHLPPGTVLAQIDLGANLLLHTHHAIIAAPYHRAVDGLVAGIEAFAGTEEDMRRAALRHGADYLVLCRKWLPREADAGAPFASRLAEAATVPWLEPVELGPGPLSAWRIRKP